MPIKRPLGHPVMIILFKDKSPSKYRVILLARVKTSSGLYRTNGLAMFHLMLLE